MPPEPPPNLPPSSGGKPRRRSAPGMGGNWMWTAILLLLVALLLAQSMAPSGNLDWTDFLELTKPDTAANIKKIVLVGNDQITVEVKNADELPPEIKSKLSRGGRFTVQRPHLDLDQGLSKRLDELAAR